MVHINFGLLLGVITELKEDVKKALFGRGAWFILEAGAALLYFKNPLGWALLGISVVLLGKFEGVGGVLEIPGLFGNLVSYTRLGAIGLASAGIAMAVNLLAEMSGSLGILVLIVGHSLNIVLGILDPFIQATRLHLVEFFSKFYVPARRVFQPLSLKHEYTGGEVIWQ